MPKTDIWPYEANTITDKGATFKTFVVTVREWFPAKDGTSQAGKQYHLPPRLSFEEDPEREEWAWKEWDGSSFQDFPGPFPLQGDMVQVKLKASKKTGDSGGYFRDIAELSQTGQSAPQTQSPDNGAVAPEQQQQAPQPPVDPNAANKSALGRLPKEEVIAGLSTFNTSGLMLEIWQQEPDGSEWKETMREAGKKIGLAAIPPSLLHKVQELVKENAPTPAEDDSTEEEVQELPW